MQKSTYIFIIICCLLFFIINLQSSKIIEQFTQYKECNYEHMVLDQAQLNDTKELLVKFIAFTEEKNIDYFAIHKNHRQFHSYHECFIKSILFHVLDF